VDPINIKTGGGTVEAGHHEYAVSALAKGGGEGGKDKAEVGIKPIWLTPLEWGLNENLDLEKQNDTAKLVL
jgi:hypothetical protein